MAGTQAQNLQDNFNIDTQTVFEIKVLFCAPSGRTGS